jgi:hypothetical protein
MTGPNIASPSLQPVPRTPPRIASVQSPVSLPTPPPSQTFIPVATPSPSTLSLQPYQSSPATPSAPGPVATPSPSTLSLQPYQSSPATPSAPGPAARVDYGATLPPFVSTPTPAPNPPLMYGSVGSYSHTMMPLSAPQVPATLSALPMLPNGGGVPPHNNVVSHSSAGQDTGNPSTPEHGVVSFVGVQSTSALVDVQNTAQMENTTVIGVQSATPPLFGAFSYTTGQTYASRNPTHAATTP